MEKQTTIAARACSAVAFKRVNRREAPIKSGIPPLENGQFIDGDEFMRRYEAMPDIKKAELIQGKVYIMSSPVRIKFHGRQDCLMQGWLIHYELATPGIEAASNSTSKLDIRNIPQPDSLLRLLPEAGGKTTIDEKGYLVGPPELVVEIAASSASIDLNDKLKAYQQAGVAEYIAWCTEDERLTWLYLKDGKYAELRAGEDGIHRSRVFPGLWLDTAALLRGDKKRVFAVLKRGLKSPEHAKFVKRIAHS